MKIHNRSFLPLVCAIVVLLLTWTHIEAQPSASSNRGLAKLEIAGKTISINYGRPLLNGRDLDKEAPVGQVWRLGMNQATTIQTGVDLYTCCGVVKEGSYSLWAKKVGENKWELIFNSETGQWGTQHNALKDILSVPMQLEASKESIEQFTITVVKTAKGGEIRCAWGTQILVAEFSTKA
jgi:hypothetical protein